MIEPFILPNGTKHWYLNGKLHREDGPAIVHLDGYKAWYLNGKLHRVDGPAVIHSDRTRSWFLDGEPITELTDELKKDHPKIYDQLLIYGVMES